MRPPEGESTASTLLLAIRAAAGISSCFFSIVI